MLRTLRVGNRRPGLAFATRRRVSKTRPALRFVVFCVSLLCANNAFAQSKGQFRVCADPENMPHSNQKQEGFENKIAALIAKDFSATPRYTWWGQRRGFIRNTMNATLEEGRCDVVIGVPEGYDLVSPTKPYYRSTYVFVTRRARGLRIESFDDPVLRRVRVGVQLIGDDGANSPPAHALSRRGIVQNLVGYSVYNGLIGHINKHSAEQLLLSEADARNDIIWDQI